MPGIRSVTWHRAMIQLVSRLPVASHRENSIPLKQCWEAINDMVPRHSAAPWYRASPAHICPATLICSCYEHRYAGHSWVSRKLEKNREKLVFPSRIPSLADWLCEADWGVICTVCKEGPPPQSACLFTGLIWKGNIHRFRSGFFLMGRLNIKEHFVGVCKIYLCKGCYVWMYEYVSLNLYRFWTARFFCFMEYLDIRWPAV